MTVLIVLRRNTTRLVSDYTQGRNETVLHTARLSFAVYRVFRLIDHLIAQPTTQ